MSQHDIYILTIIRIYIITYVRASQYARGGFTAGQHGREGGESIFCGVNFQKIALLGYDLGSLFFLQQISEIRLSWIKRCRGIGIQTPTYKQRITWKKFQESALFLKTTIPRVLLEHALNPA